MKYILKEPKEDDRIFKQGFIISQPKIQNIDLVKIPKKMSRKERVLHLIKSLIKLGWKYKEVKMTVFYLRRNVCVPVKYEILYQDNVSFI